MSQEFKSLPDSSTIITEDAPSGRPIFIVGLSRSGSTLLSKMLDAHSALAIFPETWCYVQLDLLDCLDKFRDPWQYIIFMNRLWHSMRDYKDVAAAIVAKEALNRPRYTGPSRPIIEALGRAYAGARNAKFWGEKTPGHILWLEDIYRLFPDSRVLVTLRDPRDVLLSYDDRWGGAKRETRYLMQAAAQVRHYLNHFLRCPGFPAQQIRVVRYESLTAEPTATLREVCEFLGLEFEPAMLEFYRSRSDFGNGSSQDRHHQLLRRAATTERIGRYREALSSSQLAMLEEFLAAEMEAFQYPTHAPANCILSRDERRSLHKGTELFQMMVAGKIRRKLRRRARLKLAAYRHIPFLSSAPRARMAVTSSDWLARLTGNQG